MKTYKVLFVDDQHLICAVLSKIAGRHGFTVLTAGSEIQARAIIDEQTQIDLLMTDYDLSPSGSPQGGNGESVAQYFCDKFPLVTRVGMSGGDMHRFGQSVHILMAKPFDADVVVAILESAKAESDYADQNPIERGRIH